MKVKILSLRRAKFLRNNITWYATVQSRTRGTRVNHSVVRIGNGKRFDCSCEDSILRQNKNCDHIKAVQQAIAKRFWTALHRGSK